MRTWGARNSQSFATSQAQAATSWKTEIAGFRWLWCPSIQLVLIFCPSSHMHVFLRPLSFSHLYSVRWLHIQLANCLSFNQASLYSIRPSFSSRGAWEWDYVMWCASFNLYRALKLVLPTPKDCCWHDRLFSLKHFGPYQFLMYIQWVVYHDNPCSVCVLCWSKYISVLVRSRDNLNFRSHGNSSGL